jgi:hypothetical protein
MKMMMLNMMMMMMMMMMMICLQIQATNQGDFQIPETRCT